MAPTFQIDSFVTIPHDDQLPVQVAKLCESTDQKIQPLTSGTPSDEDHLDFTCTSIRLEHVSRGYRHRRFSEVCERIDFPAVIAGHQKPALAQVPDRQDEIEPPPIVGCIRQCRQPPDDAEGSRELAGLREQPCASFLVEGLLKNLPDHWMGSGAREHVNVLRSCFLEQTRRGGRCGLHDDLRLPEIGLNPAHFSAPVL